MNSNITRDVPSLLSGLPVNTHCEHTLELVIETFDQWANRPDAAVEPTASQMPCLAYVNS